MTTTLTTITRRIAAQQEALKADPPTVANPYTGEPQAAFIYRPGDTPYVDINGINIGTVQIVGTYRGVAALYTLNVAINVRRYEDGPTLRYTLSDYHGAEPIHGQTASPVGMTEAHVRHVFKLAADTLGAAHGERVTYTRAQALAALARAIASDVRRGAQGSPDSAYREATYRLRGIYALDAIIVHATSPAITDADLNALARKVARDALKDAKREVVNALAKLG